MKILNSALKWKLVLGVLMVMVIANAGTLMAEDASIIQIFKSPNSKTDLMLSPPDLYVKKNTVVIWMNGIQGEEIQVVFKDGKACKDVSFSPEYKGFSLDSKSCYVTSFIP